MQLEHNTEMTARSDTMRRSEYTETKGRPITLEIDVLIPLLQTCLYAWAGLLVVGAIGGIVGLPENVWASLTALAGAILFSIGLRDSLGWTRHQTGVVLRRETRIRTGAAALATERHDTVTVQIVKLPAGQPARADGAIPVGATIEWAELGADLDTLRAALTLPRLSRRSLVALGMSERQATQLLTTLLERGFITRPDPTRPATLTHGGHALRRSLAEPAPGVPALEG